MGNINEPMEDTGQWVICPNCGHRQWMTANDAICDSCGQEIHAATSGETAIEGEPIPGVYDPSDVAPPPASGGIGRTTDGTQAPLQVPTAIPGKPMAPIANSPAGRDSSLGGEEMNVPVELPPGLGDEP